MNRNEVRLPPLLVFALGTVFLLTCPYMRVTEPPDFLAGTSATVFYQLSPLLIGVGAIMIAGSTSRLVDGRWRALSSRRSLAATILTTVVMTSVVFIPNPGDALPHTWEAPRTVVEVLDRMFVHAGTGVSAPLILTISFTLGVASARSDAEWFLGGIITLFVVGAVTSALVGSVWNALGFMLPGILLGPVSYWLGERLALSESGVTTGKEGTTN